MNFRRKQIEDIDVNITPLIDIVFLLLIFFMVSTTFEHQSELSIDLPQASGDEAQVGEKTVIDIAIDSKGTYYLDREKMADQQQLRQKLAQLSKTKKDPRVIISADKLTPHQAVMTVLDIARQLDIHQLTFAAVIPD